MKEIEELYRVHMRSTCDVYVGRCVKTGKRFQEASLIFENQLRARVRAQGELDEDLMTSIGPLSLKVTEALLGKSG